MHPLSWFNFISLRGTPYRDHLLVKKLLPSAAALWLGRIIHAFTNNFTPNVEMSYSRWMNLQAASAANPLFHVVSHQSLGESGSVVLFSRQEVEEGRYINHFSAPSPNSRSLNGRVVVKYTGLAARIRILHVHTSTSVEICFRNLYRWISLPKTIASDGCSIDYSGLWSVESVSGHFLINFLVPQGRLGAREADSVSHLPFAPPPWAMLDSDPVLCQRPTQLEDVPEILRLMGTSSCGCSEPRCLLIPLGSSVNRNVLFMALYDHGSSEPLRRKDCTYMKGVTRMGGVYRDSPPRQTGNPEEEYPRHRQRCGEKHV